MASCNCCGINTSDRTISDKLSSLLKVIGEDNKLRLLCALQQDCHCVSELEEHTKLSQSLISHHLSDLRRVGLISGSKKGQKVFYSLTDLGSKTMKSLLAINS